MTNASKRNLIATLKNEQHIKRKRSESIFSSELRVQEGSTKITNTVDELVFGLLKKHGSVTRSKLVEITGLPRTTLYDSLIRLIIKGFVRKFNEDRNLRGRPKVFYQLSV